MSTIYFTPSVPHLCKVGEIPPPAPTVAPPMSSIVTMAVSLTVYEIFSVKE